MKKFLRKGLLTVLIVCLFSALLTACSSTKDLGVNLLKNGGFEEIKDGIPEDWSTESWNEEPKGNIRAEAAADAKEGSAVGIVENTRSNDSRLTQTVSVKPNSYYVLSAWVRTESVEDSSTLTGDTEQQSRVGANLSVLNVYSHSEELFGDTGWTHIYLYGKTGSGQREMTVAVRLGFYSGETLGKAFFDDVCLERIESIPEGQTEISFEPVIGQDSGDDTVDSTEKNITKAITTILMVAAFAAAAGYFLTKYIFKKPKANLFQDKTGLFLILGIGLIIRVVLAVTYLGFSVDIGCFSAWGGHMLSDGPFKFYAQDYFCDYPPLYMFVLGIVSGLRQLLGATADTGMGLLILKSPAIIADVISALLIYKIGKEKLGNKIATLLSCLYFLNPAILVNSSSWGQIDSILAVLLIFCFYLIQQKKYAFSVLIYLAAILTKPQAIVFGPIMIFGLIDEVVRIIKDVDPKDKSNRIRNTALAFAGSFFIFLGLSIAMKNDNTSIFWLVQKYLTTISSYQYAALNVFNLHSFLGGQWAPLTDAALFGISYKWIGTVGIVLVTIAAFVCYFKKRDIKYFWLLAAFLAVGSVMLGSSAHERYLYPALAMLLMSYIYLQDKRLLAIFGGFSIVHYINVSVVLHQYMINETYMASNSMLMILGSFASLMLFGYLIYVMWDLMFRDRPEPVTIAEPDEVFEPDAQPQKAKLSQSKVNRLQTLMFLENRKHKSKARFTWKDYTIVIAITAIYAVVAYTNLGNNYSPETYWYPQPAQDYVIADFGQTQTVDEIYLNVAKSGGSITVSYSDDKSAWSKVEKLYLDSSMTNRWVLVADDSEKLPLSARYMKITADSDGIALNELVFRSEGEIIPIKDTEGRYNPLTSTANNFDALFDQQSSLTAYLNAGGEYMPSKAWAASGEGDGFIMDMGKEVSIAQIYCNMATCSEYSTFNLTYSNDKNTWSEWITYSPSENQCGLWEAIMEEGGAAISARYIKLTAEFSDFSINEMTLYADTALTDAIVPVSFEGIGFVLSGSDEYLGDSLLPDVNYQACFDEQSTFTIWKTSGDTFSTGAYWDIEECKDYVIADFGSVQKLQRMYYFNGIGEGTFTVKYSVDKENWTDLQTVTYTSGMMYKWQLIESGTGTTARYVLITADIPYFRMLECGFYSSADAQEPISIAKIECSDGDETASCVFDEQDTVPLRSSYMNSMYFDEIYHARTAYESLNGMTIYEITHPPLGKDIMSWGVSVFGMNPFGWRFAGTLMGVLMLPALYVFGKKLFGKTSLATALTLLMAADGMHFVQTRIATIDSYGVFFIILMFLFMYKYYTMSFNEDKLWRTLVPLGLSGIAFGLGAASKWIGIYAGGGLAVLFFMVMYERFGEYLHADRELKKSRASYSDEDIAYLEKIRSTYKRNTLITLLWCVLFFVIVPVTIYCISYYPYFDAPGNQGAWYKTVWANQKYMLSYHSGLTGDTHPFRSAWYQWPIIYKPMWFYKGDELVSTNMECISSFGNPLVWYTGLVCTISSFILLVIKIKKRYLAKTTEALLSRKKEIALLLFVFIGLATNFLPWVLVTRSTFIYHYFASLPFIMILTVYIWQQLIKHYEKKAYIAMAIFFVLVIVMFAFFYPVWSGMEVNKEYVNDFLRWMGSWYFGS